MSTENIMYPGTNAGICLKVILLVLLLVLILFLSAACAVCAVGTIVILSAVRTVLKFLFLILVKIILRHFAFLLIVFVLQP